MPPNRRPRQKTVRPGRSSNFTCAFSPTSPEEKLRQPGDTGDFIALVVQTARECSFAIGADDVNAAMRASMPGAVGLIDNAVRETPLPPEGWLPVRASWHDGQLYAHWSYFGDQPLREPFFQGDVQRALFKPFNRLFRYTTPIAKLGGWLQEHPGLRPDGFIFHMSRCGSTWSRRCWRRRRPISWFPKRNRSMPSCGRARRSPI